MSLYETIAFGLSVNLTAYENIPKNEQTRLILSKAKELWGNPDFERNSGAGVRGTTRLANLLPMAKGFFKP